MKDISHSFKKLCVNNREGSYATISNRERMLVQIGNQLHELGFRHLKNVDQLKQKHIWSLVENWKESEITSAAIKNRMSALRWVAKKTENSSLISKNNSKYGIENRVYVSNKDKSLTFDAEKIQKISDLNVRMSAELQQAFGLRREESMKLIPTVADKGSDLELRGSWTKGGKPRTIPIKSENQREILERAKLLVGQGSMIPTHLKYVQHMRVFENQMSSVGLGRTHGARHLYAQNRYKELTGREAPVIGGKSRSELSEAERVHDDNARLTISKELGHERIQIVALYIGS